MAIKKQEFYEGAALHLLARSGKVTAIEFDPPFFLINRQKLIHLKYSTRNRSPWAFTFMPDEQLLLENLHKKHPIHIGLICGFDGIASCDYDSYRTIAAPRDRSLHLSCYRDHHQHYEICGPDGDLPRKVSPSAWQRILD